MSLAVLIDYTNWRGERRVRRVLPLNFVYRANEWHKEEQWIMTAHDLDSDEERQFALAGIHSWKPAEE
jgi:predicted DNA-binding transcriptional regulator YafY